MSNSKSNKLQDQIFWYKAEPHGNFRLGSKEFWDISKEINSDDDEDVVKSYIIYVFYNLNVKYFCIYCLFNG